MKEGTVAGIIGYGAYLPFARIEVEEIHRVWRNTSLDKVKNILKVNERAVLQPNEDTITLAVAAAKGALEQSGVDRAKIDALFLGTCTNPYDSRPSTTVIAEAIGINPHFIGGDVQFSGIVEIEGTSSYASDLSDFFRMEGERYIQNIGAGGELFPAWEIGFVDHIVHAGESLMKEMNLKPKDYSFAIFQQPYGFAPFAIGERLGFTKEQIEPGVIAPMIGDCGAASSLLGLVHVLDNAEKGQRIFLTSYGFGAGSDALSLEVTSALEAKRPRVPLSKYLYEKKNMVDYATACRLEYKYMQDLNPLYI